MTPLHNPRPMIRSASIIVTMLLVLLLSVLACSEKLDEETYVRVKIEQLRLQFEESLTTAEALELATSNHNTTVEALLDFAQELEQDPDHLRAVQEKIDRATDELLTPSLYDDEPLIEDTQ